MKKKRFNESQIICILKMGESGHKVKDLCRMQGIHPQTYYNWKKKYSGMSVPELRRLKTLEQENTQLKRLVARLSLDKQIMEDIVGGKL